MKCSDAEKLLSAYIDGTLNDDDKAKFEEHIDNCSACRREYHIMNAMIASCRKLGDIDLPENFRHDLHERLIEEKGLKKRSIYRFIGKYKALVAAFLMLAVVIGTAAGIGLFGGSPKRSASTAQTQQASGSAKDQETVSNDVKLFNAPSSPALDRKNPENGADAGNSSDNFVNVNISKAEYDKYSKDIISFIESIEGQKISSTPLQYTIPKKFTSEFISKMKDSFKIYDVMVTPMDSAPENNNEKLKSETPEYKAIIQININE
jgi:hypothetical protein